MFGSQFTVSNEIAEVALTIQEVFLVQQQIVQAGIQDKINAHNEDVRKKLAEKDDIIKDKVDNIAMLESRTLMLERRKQLISEKLDKEIAAHGETKALLEAQKLMCQEGTECIFVKLAHDFPTGMDLHWSSKKVQNLEDGSYAAQCGVRVGDELICIDGENLEDKTWPMINKLLKRRPVSLLFGREAVEKKNDIKTRKSLAEKSVPRRLCQSMPSAPPTSPVPSNVGSGISTDSTLNPQTTGSTPSCNCVGCAGNSLSKTSPPPTSSSPPRVD